MTKMKYIIMCGGTYVGWDVPRQLTPINGEPIIARTIRLLRECGVEDIAISSNDERFNGFGVPVLHHENNFRGYKENSGDWVDGFYLVEEPVCYIFGDVFFSPAAIETIVNTETNDIDFFASAPPFADNYIKRWEEPFAFKVMNAWRFSCAIKTVKDLQKRGKFERPAIAWELWEVINNSKPNKIIYNYTVINDYTCDIDVPEDVPKIKKILEEIWSGEKSEEVE